MKFINPNFKKHGDLLTDTQEADLKAYIESVPDSEKFIKTGDIKDQLSRLLGKPKSKVTRGEVHQVMQDLGYEMVDD